MQRFLKYTSAFLAVFMAIISPIFAVVSTGGGYSIHTQINSSGGVSSGGSYTLQSGSAPLNKISTGGSYTLIGGAYRSNYNDTDNDGVADMDELQGLNGGDSNGDGIADFLQPLIATIPGYDTTHAYGIEIVSATCNQIISLDDRTEPSVSEDTAYTYPAGLLDFELGCTIPGDSATVRIYFDADYSATMDTWVFRKWHGAQWSSLDPQPTLSSYTFVTGPLAGNTVTTATYSLIDGGINDADDVSDSRIVDPIGPGVLVNTPNVAVRNGGSVIYPQKDPLLNSAGEEIPEECRQNSQGNWYRSCSLTPPDATFADFADNVACEGFIAERDTLEAYELSKYTPRQEALAVALKMKKSKGENISLIPQSQYSHHYNDIAKTPRETDWVPGVVETALVHGMISSERKVFEPNRSITRAETYAMIMKAVCIQTSSVQNAKNKEQNGGTWQQTIHTTALDIGLTTRAWSQFDPESPILRQELMVLASRAADWAEFTGGCDPKPPICPRLNPDTFSSAGTKSLGMFLDNFIDTTRQISRAYISDVYDRLHRR